MRSFSRTSIFSFGVSREGIKIGFLRGVEGSSISIMASSMNFFPSQGNSYNERFIGSRFPLDESELFLDGI